MESFFFLFFPIKCTFKSENNRPMIIFPGSFYGVTPPESYSYLMVPLENYRLLDSFTVNNKEYKLTQNIIIKDLYLYSINNTPSNATVKAASKISCHTQYSPVSSLAQHSKSIAVKIDFKYTDYKIGICCFSAKHAALRRKN